MSDTKETEAEINADTIRREERTERTPRGNVHSEEEQGEAPGREAPPPLGNPYPASYGKEIATMLIIAGHVFVDPADLDEFIADARRTLPLGRAAEGNLFFSFTVDDPAEGSVTVLERWRDKASLDAYLARPEVIAIFTRWGGRMRNEVMMYDASNERSPRG